MLTESTRDEALSAAAEPLELDATQHRYESRDTQRL
jgi:hypothetical protein